MQTSAGDDERQHQARAGLLRAGRGEHENARADDAADAEQGQLERAERAVQRLLLGRRQNGVERFDAARTVRPLGAWLAIDTPLEIRVGAEPSGFDPTGAIP